MSDSDNEYYAEIDYKGVLVLGSGFATMEISYSDSMLEITADDDQNSFSQEVTLTDLIRKLKIPKEDVLRAYDGVGGNE